MMIKRSTILLAVLVLALGISVLPAFAQGRSGGGRGMGGPPSGMGGSPSGMGAGHDPLGTSGPSSHPGPGSTAGPGSEPTTTGRRTMSDLLTQNTKLASKINDLTGMDAQTACAGFKNLGQCVAAAHVSKNLGIGFDTLKGKVTGPDAENLGKAIHGLNPNVSAKAEAKKAQKQAHADLKQSSS